MLMVRGSTLTSTSELSVANAASELLGERLTPTNVAVDLDAFASIFNGLTTTLASPRLTTDKAEVMSSTISRSADSDKSTCELETLGSLLSITGNVVIVNEGGVMTSVARAILATLGTETPNAGTSIK